MKRLFTLFAFILISCVAVIAQTKIYRGNSTYSSDILYTFDKKYAYKGRSTYSSDILCTVDGPIPAAVMMIVLF